MVLAALPHPLPRCTTCSSFLFDNDKFVACLPTSSTSAPPLVSWPPPQARHRWSAGLLYERITADLLVKPTCTSPSSLTTSLQRARVTPGLLHDHAVVSLPDSFTCPLCPHVACSPRVGWSPIAREYGEQREH
jgi:hypothetical protein